MKWLASGVAFVCASTVTSLLLGMLAHGVTKTVAVTSLLAGALIALFAWRQTTDTPKERATKVELIEETSGTKRKAAQRMVIAPIRYNYSKSWMWLLAVCFALMAVRSFCWLLYIDGEQLKIQSPNNLGDLSLHLTYIRNFANGVALWPDNPIYTFSQLRYPAGTDLFNALLAVVGVDVLRGLVWTGLVASVATFYAFYRWAGTFGVAAFLFNGGVAGYQFFRKWEFLDYQGDKSIAWKSIPLSMFVPQRGMLYALPVGLLLLCHWRSKFAPLLEERTGTPFKPRGFLPLWLEILLYASLPLFHAHTFLALSFVLAFFFLLNGNTAKRQTALLAAISFIPAAFFAWLITDHFRAGSVLQWKPGWVQDVGDFAMPFLKFWLVNFWIWLPAMCAMLYLCVKRLVTSRKEPSVVVPQSVTFLSAATALFLLTYFVKTAPWEWDNIKILVWAYFLVLPFLWSEMLSLLHPVIRGATYVLLFASGFVSLLGGLSAGQSGFGIADRNELDNVGAALRKVPVEARFAAYPTYNQPILLQGRKCVLGYPGHLWTQGFNYSAVESKLKSLMLGQGNWKETAHELKAQYLFWGSHELANYAGSTRPWERESALVAAGPWGAIYNLEQPRIQSR